MNNRELLERALGETGSIQKAVELVKQWNALIEPETTLTKTLPYDGIDFSDLEKRIIAHQLADGKEPISTISGRYTGVGVIHTYIDQQTSTQVAEFIPEGDLFAKMEEVMAGDEPKPASKPVVQNEDKTRGRHSWLPNERTLAANLLDAGHDYESVGKIMKRSSKAVATAVGRGILTPKKDPRSMVRRAASYKGAIAAGRNIRDYEVADEVLKQVEK